MIKRDIDSFIGKLDSLVTNLYYNKNNVRDMRLNRFDSIAEWYYYLQCKNPSPYMYKKIKSIKYKQLNKSGDKSVKRKLNKCIQVCLGRPILSS